LRIPSLHWVFVSHSAAMCSSELLGLIPTDEKTLLQM
jgi:hypothetical protein